MPSVTGKSLGPVVFTTAGKPVDFMACSAVALGPTLRTGCDALIVPESLRAGRQQHNKRSSVFLQGPAESRRNLLGGKGW
jgi:hypothetical protein